MSYERNAETMRDVSQEIKAMKDRCQEACDNIVNYPPETPVTPDNVSEKTFSYIEGVNTVLQNSITHVVAHSMNLVTTQFLNEIKEKTVQNEELTAFTRGECYEIDAEIDRLNIQIKIAEEAMTRPKPVRQEVRREHMHSAKERFQLMKNELHGLMDSLFPNQADSIKEVLGDLMTQRLDIESSGYIPLDHINYSIIQILKEKNLVVFNPYNDKEVKLAY